MKLDQKDFFKLRRYLGQDFVDDLNYASNSGRGHFVDISITYHDSPKYGRTQFFTIEAGAKGFHRFPVCTEAYRQQIYRDFPGLKNYI